MNADSHCTLFGRRYGFYMPLTPSATFGGRRCCRCRRQQRLSSCSAKHGGAPAAVPTAAVPTAAVPTAAVPTAAAAAAATAAATATATATAAATPTAAAAAAASAAPAACDACYACSPSTSATIVIADSNPKSTSTASGKRTTRDTTGVQVLGLVIRL